MKDIGSIFPLYYEDLISMSTVGDTLSTNHNVLLFSLCREALFTIANSLSSSSKKVLLPAYTCDTVVKPFKELGWECFFYPVNKSLRINVDKVRELFQQHAIILIIVHPYYGKDLNNDEVSLLNELHDDGCKVVVDLTQSIFSKQELSFVDYYVGSYRKWFAIPDGGFLKSKDESCLSEKALEENEVFVSFQKDAMYLRGLYFDSGNEEVKSISRKLNKMAVEMVDSHIMPHKMSAASLVLMNGEDLEFNQARRMENYKYLNEHLANQEGVVLVCNKLNEVTSAPLYFTIYVQDRKELQSDLAAEHIYAPVIWPVIFNEVLVDETVKEIYSTILALPIDQRYGQSDMNKIIEVIKKHYHE